MMDIGDEVTQSSRGGEASSTYDDLVGKIRAFERDLDEGQELHVSVQGVRVGQIGLGQTAIMFWGSEEDVLIVQHHTQLNVTIAATSPPEGKPPRAIGFLD